MEAHFWEEGGWMGRGSIRIISTGATSPSLLESSHNFMTPPGQLFYGDLVGENS